MLLRSLLLLAAVAPVEARAADIVVNLSSDEADPDPDDGTPDVDLAAAGLQVTLRSAIQFANRSPGADRITFALAAPVLMPAELPDIGDELTIDGSLTSGTVRIEGRGLVIRARRCAVTNLAIAFAPSDAIFSVEAVSLGAVELTKSVLGFGVRSGGHISIAGGTIAGNAKGGVLSWGGSVNASDVVIESNGGPGIMALLGIRLSSRPDGVLRVRTNGGGLHTDGTVMLQGEGLHRISGNFGDGIRSLGGLNAQSPVEILDNASFGVRALSDIVLSRTATVTGNGRGFLATVPDAIAMDPTFTVLMGDAVRGGGLLSAGGEIIGGEIVANDNGGAGIVSAGDVYFDRAEVSRNDGNGIDALGDVRLGQASIEGNFGVGILNNSVVSIFFGARIEGNASAGIFCRSVFLEGVVPNEIRNNGKLDRASATQYDETLAVSYREVPVIRAGVRAEVTFSAAGVEVAENGGDGVACDNFDITDGMIIDNEGAGLRATRGGKLTRTILCNNEGGDLIHFRDVELDESSGACDREMRIAEEGCGCTAAHRGSGSIVWILIGLCLLRRRLGLLVLSACTVEQAFFVPPPPPEDASSVVFALESEDLVKLEARPVAKGEIEPVTIEFDRLGRSQIWTLYYDLPLEEHGLTAGTVRVTESGSPLDRPDRMHRAEFLAGRLGAWSEEAELSLRLRTLAVERAPPSGPCLELYDEQSFTLETHRDSAFALRFDGERALIATTDARVYFAGSGGVTPLGTAAPVTIGSGYLAPDGELVVAGANGRTFKGPVEPELALVEIASGESGGLFRWIDGPKQGGTLELFGVTNLGALERFDGASWSVLFPPQGIEDWKRGVAWIAPGEAIAVGLSAPIVRTSSAGVEVEEADNLDPLTSVAHVPGLGTFAGTLAGTVLMNRGERWELLPSSPLELPATAIAAIGPGVIISGGTGRTAEWLPGHGFCAPISVNSPIVKHVAVLDGAVVFLGDARDDAADPTAVSVLRFR
jgi:hypothetical protein